MKVLYIVGGAKKTLGSERVAIEIIKGLSGNKIEFIVITANKGPVNSICEEIGIENYVVPFEFYVYKKEKGQVHNLIKQKLKCAMLDWEDYRALKYVEEHVNLNSVDIIHSNLSRTLLGARLAKKYNKPHVWHLQELLFGHYGLDLLKPHQIEWMNNRCSKYIAVSEAVKYSWIQGGIDKDKVIRIYNGIDYNRFNEVYANRFCKNENNLNGPIRLVMMGSLCDEKGQHILLEALHLLGNKKSLFTVDFYGTGYAGKEDSYESNLKSMAKRYNIETNFHGFVNNAYKELSQYDVGVVCSKGEAFGLSTLEYMCSALCVISSNNGAGPELINSSHIGMLYNREDSKDLACCLEFLADNPCEIGKYGRKGRDYVTNNFNIDIQLKEIEKIYYGLTNN